MARVLVLWRCFDRFNRWSVTAVGRFWNPQFRVARGSPAGTLATVPRRRVGTRRRLMPVTKIPRAVPLVYT